jgi:alkanesulfonate monooxygenase SsuD/methylene tetrahydromethanopterin reductase-like flavin-dependent oxidoreductase (luciferase family)
MLAGPDDLRRKFAILRDHCEDAGRDYDEIHRTATTPCVIADSDEAALAAFPPGAGALWDGDVREYGLIGTPETIRRRLAAYEAAGVQELAISFGGPDPLATLRRYAAEIMRTSPAPSLPRSGTAARS